MEIAVFISDLSSSNSLCKSYHLNFFLQNQDGLQSEHQKLACSRNLWVGNVGEASPTNFNSFSSKSAPC